MCVANAERVDLSQFGAFGHWCFGEITLLITSS
jgi:hypothetical protein